MFIRLFLNCKDVLCKDVLARAPKSARFALPAILALGCLVAGCGGGAGAEKSGAKSGTPAASAGASSAQSAPASASGGAITAAGLRFAPPAAWVAEKPSSSMRIAQLRIPSGKSGVEDGLVTVFHFGPGGGGGVDANLKRWAGQFKQEDGSDPMSHAKTAKLESSGFQITTIELDGRYVTGPMSMETRQYDEPGWALIGGIVEGNGGPWFFKGVGPKEVVTANRAAFLEMLKSGHLAG